MMSKIFLPLWISLDFEIDTNQFEEISSDKQEEVISHLIDDYHHYYSYNSDITLYFDCSKKQIEVIAIKHHIYSMLWIRKEIEV